MSEGEHWFLYRYLPGLALGIGVMTLIILSVSK